MLFTRRFASVLSVGLTGALLAGCSSALTSESDGASTTSQSSASASQATEVGMVIDVRTPDEYADDHIKGATNIDFNSDAFANDITKLDKNGTYTLHCHSGNRAGQALKLMQEAGFTNVMNAGGFQDASKNLGIELVTE
ncbi:MAG: rhodanese-like domain-containing protein [Schaalia turicensis]|nr:rhodanese-like domain-containing protein [Schaalia turicensis]